MQGWNVRIGRLTDAALHASGLRPTTLAWRHRLALSFGGEPAEERGGDELPKCSISVPKTRPMDFIDRLKALSASAQDRVAHTRTEEATKTALVLPFLQALGYDVFDPREVVPEYVADVGTKRGEKVDYAVLQDGKPIIIIECKAVGVELDPGKVTQLFRYFTSTTARFGILTDGMVYQFYSDLEEPNKMDTKPFLVFDLVEITEEGVQHLKRFARGSFDMEDSLRAAENLMYTASIKWVLDDMMRRPHRDFVRFILEQVRPGGMKTQALVDKFTDITKQAFREFINAKINARLQTALQGEDEADAGTLADEPQRLEETGQKRAVVTTEDELRAYEVIKEILKDTIAEERIELQDKLQYCSVVLDGNSRMNIVRMYLGQRKKTIRVYDDQTWQPYQIESPQAIWEHADVIRTRTKRLLESG